MLENMQPAITMKGLARARGRDYETKTIPKAALADALADGWTVERENEKSVRLRRSKATDRQLRDRVWMLLYRTGFGILSGLGDTRLQVDAKAGVAGWAPVDVVGIDDEIALAVFCRNSSGNDRWPHFGRDLAQMALVREKFAQTVNRQYEAPAKRQAVVVAFTSGITLSESEREKATAGGIVVFDEHDLTYYENLAGHLGPASKYQLFANMLPGKAVPGLALRVPAIRVKMGGAYAYTFSMTPEYLLKISYVSHRAKGRASDVHTYQRMLNKGRLKKIRTYISNDGIFPTNIVVSLEDKRARFERIEQDDQENGVLGWLDIRPAYRSAWIIDGQHRLFAYSGHEYARRARLSVLAFDNLPPSKQAALFIDINAKQKSVKQSLLQELYAELHWDASEPEVRASAIMSKTVQVLDADSDSALHARIQTADVQKDWRRCISLASIYGALERTEFFIAQERKGHVLEFGPLWAGSNEDTLRRTVTVLKSWFNLIRQRASDWWDRGSGEGGGLAMNDGVTTCLNVLRSVMAHLAGNDLIKRSTLDVCTAIEPYGIALGDYFGSLSDVDRKAFRDLRGVQGQTKRTRMCQAAIRLRIPSFNPTGLDQFLAEEKAQTNTRAKGVIDRIETTLFRFVVEELRQECGEDESEWWLVGVPKSVRQKASQRFEDDDGKRGAKENYFDLIDYRNIITNNWELFGPVLGFGKTGSKDRKTDWLAFVNERRKIVAHPTSAGMVSIEDLSRLEEYDRWLEGQVSGAVEDGGGMGDGGEREGV